MKFPNFVGPAYTSQSPNVDCERTVNWYPEITEAPGAKANIVLYPCPGFESFADLSPGPVRALYAINGRTFAVSGYVFYEISTTGVATNRGSVAIDANPATISSNGDGGDQLFITSGDHGYCFDLTSNTLTTVLASGCTVGDFLDGFFLSLDTATATFRISDLLDGTTWDATQYAQRNTGADTWQAMQVVHREIWLLGSQTSDVFYNSGAFPFPFAPIPGAFIQQGTQSTFSLASLNQSLIWLSHNAQGSGMVMRSNGYTADRISTHAIEWAIQRYETIEDAQAFTYQEQGHNFYVLLFPSAKATWVWDMTTNLWHERGYWVSNDNQFDSIRVACHCHPHDNISLVGNRLTGEVYRMSVSIATDVDGLGMRRQRRARGLSQDETWILYGQMQLDMESGLGLATGQGSDPQVMLRISRDGGHTWGNEYWASAGKIGQYSKRVVWNRLGRSRNAAFEVTVTDPIPWRITQAFLTVRKGLS